MVAIRSRKNIVQIGFFLGFLLVIYVLVHLSPSGDSRERPDVMVPVAGPDSATQSRIQENFGKLPLYFIENQGQVDSRVAYYVQGLDKSFYFTQKGLTLVLSGEGKPFSPPKAGIHRVSYAPSSYDSGLRPAITAQHWVVKIDFVGANPEVRPVARGRRKAILSYFKGPREKWKTGLRTYTSVVYPDLWPGIDLVYTGTVDQLKYMFLVKPDTDPEIIRLAYRGATSVKVNNAGQLVAQTPLGDFHDDVPYAYQEVEGQRVEVEAAYSLRVNPDKGATVYGFELGSYDSSRPLVLDPAVLAYCGYIGGSSSDTALAIAVDGDGNAYITGYTYSSQTTFPVTVGPDLTHNGASDVFVAKVNATGTELDYCGYIGGSGTDSVTGIAVDGNGNAYITGDTYSTESTFPVTVGPDLTYNGGARDAFIAKVNAAGTELDYCGYIGGSDYGYLHDNNFDYGRDIAVDSDGNAYITGFTTSTQATFPVTVGPDLTQNGYWDAFVAKVKADGTALDYCGYIGGSEYDRGNSIAVDGDGNVYVTGYTLSTQTNFPVTVGPDLTHNGEEDVFVAKVNATGTALNYCGYIGGSKDDHGKSIAVDGDGNAYITGDTLSTQTTFPVMVGPDLIHNGAPDVFVAKVNATGTALNYCGYIGGSEDDQGNSIAVDGNGNAYITGDTYSTESTFPVTVGPDLTHNIRSDVFVAKVTSSTTSSIVPVLDLLLLND